MKYLKQDEIDKYMMELDKYYRNILFTLPAQDEVDEMYSFLNLYVLYARQNINQEWFNIISILKSQKNNVKLLQKSPFVSRTEMLKVIFHPLTVPFFSL